MRPSTVAFAVAFAVAVPTSGCSLGDRSAHERGAPPVPPAERAPLAPGVAAPPTSSSRSQSQSPSPSPSSAAARPSEGRRSFGAALAPGTETVALATLAADPAAFDGRTVRTHGTIVRVCQRMGCWMEMSAEGTPAVRVPMAGHAFFLPRDVVGRPATVEGRVRTVALTAAAREHLASEGAEALSDSFALEATTVQVD